LKHGVRAFVLYAYHNNLSKTCLRAFEDPNNQEAMRRRNELSGNQIEYWPKNHASTLDTTPMRLLPRTWQSTALR
jgi:hypothetical protein